MISDEQALEARPPSEGRLLSSVSGFRLGASEAMRAARTAVVHVVARLHPERDSFEPDPCGTEMPFLTDSWPRG